MNKTIFAQVPADIKDTISTTAGMMLKTFDPNMDLKDLDTAKTTIREAVMFATSGGVSATCVAEIEDMGADIDNCPKNTKELANVKSWECKMSGTALTVKGADATSLVGAADSSVSGEVTKVTPRNHLEDKDFKTMWYVCPYGTENGFVAIELSNALNVGGFSMQSTDEGKGQFAFDFTGYSSLTEPEKVPFTFYLRKSAAAPASVQKVNV